MRMWGGDVDEMAWYSPLRGGGSIFGVGGFQRAKDEELSVIVLEIVLSGLF